MSIRKKEIQVTSFIGKDGVTVHEAKLQIRVQHVGDELDPKETDSMLRDSLLRFLYDEFVPHIHRLTMIAQLHAKGSSSAYEVKEIEKKILSILLGQENSSLH